MQPQVPNPGQPLRGGARVFAGAAAVEIQAGPQARLPLGGGMELQEVSDRGGLTLLEEALCVQRSHAASPSAGDSLAVDMVLYVSRGEHAGNAGHGRKTLQA
jgi:hypothetical protein